MFGKENQKNRVQPISVIVTRSKLALVEASPFFLVLDSRSALSNRDGFRPSTSRAKFNRRG